MKIKLNRFPYMCPLLEDDSGFKDGHYIFGEEWLGVEIYVEVLEESEDRWIVEIPTSYCDEYGEPVHGWLKCEILKECFDKLDV